MPDGATPPPTLKPDPNPPMISRSLDTTQVLSSFPAYVVEDEIPRSKTPEPIKVKRTKKKGVSSSKSKRTVAE
jgi:AP-3 complex subunit delta-1